MIITREAVNLLVFKMKGLGSHADYILVKDNMFYTTDGKMLNTKPLPSDSDIDPDILAVSQPKGTVLSEEAVLPSDVILRASRNIAKDSLYPYIFVFEDEKFHYLVTYGGSMSSTLKIAHSEFSYPDVVSILDNIKSTKIEMSMYLSTENLDYLVKVLKRLKVKTVGFNLHDPESPVLCKPWNDDGSCFVIMPCTRD